MRDLLLNNFWWKVTALMLAVLVWFGFQPKERRRSFFPEPIRAQYTRYFLAHPVTISKPATDSREFRVTPSVVDVTLTGSEKTLGDLGASELRAVVDVSNFSVESNSLPVVPFFPQEGGLKVDRITPERVQVEVLKP